MHYQLIGLSPSHCLSAAYLLFSQIPFAVLSCFWVNADFKSCWSPAPPVNAFRLPLLPSAFTVLDFAVRWSFPWSCMCHSLQGLGARCLGSIWGVEVPGHPVLGSLHSPSTWRRVTLGCSRFQGCHGYLPFGLWFLLPTNLSGTSSQAHQFLGFT